MRETVDAGLADGDAPAGAPPQHDHAFIHWLFIGPSGAHTPLHVDPLLTHAWLTQIRGRKRVILFPPNALPLLRDAATGKFVALNAIPPDAVAQGMECVVAEGEILFIPAFWSHAVTCVDDSMSLTYNFLPKELFGVVRAAFLAQRISAVKS